MTALARARALTKPSPAVLLITLTLVLVVALILLRPPTYMRGVAGDPQNPEPDGTMAVAQILQTHGVQVKIVRSISSAMATPTGLLVVSDPGVLTSRQLHALADMSVDTVFIGASRSIPGFLDGVSREGVSSLAPVRPGCNDPRAQAGTISTTGPVLTAPGAHGCFPGPDTGVMLTWQTDQGTTGTILPESLLWNSRLLDESNAALALRVLGESAQVTWLVAHPKDPYGRSDVASEFSLSWLWATIAVVLAALIWWRGPRFGRLVGEPLPVIVNASETTIGRGHLYRRAADLPHAATSLRLAALQRMAGRIGLSAHAQPEEVIARVSQASGVEAGKVRQLLYGPPPHTPQSLHALALSLDALENEVDPL